MKKKWPILLHLLYLCVMFFLVLLAWFFGTFFLQNAEVDLYTDILELAIFWLKNRGSTYTQVRLIHRKIRYHNTESGRVGHSSSWTLNDWKWSTGIDRSWAVGVAYYGDMQFIFVTIRFKFWNPATRDLYKERNKREISTLLSHFFVARWEILVDRFWIWRKLFKLLILLCSSGGLIRLITS